MSSSSLGRGIIGVLFLWASVAVFAQPVTFSSDTHIGPGETNYDGVSIIVTNCTLTVDGPHTFAGLEVLNGGKLTHSVSTNGILTYMPIPITEQLQLSGTNPITLPHSNIILSNLVVSDLPGTLVYTNTVDYFLAVIPDAMVILARTEGSFIPDGATVKVSYSYLQPVPAGLSLVIDGDFSVEAGGTIDVTGKGFPGGLGRGAGGTAGSPASGGGGAHGGCGGMSISNAPGGWAYDWALRPAEPGSGGGSSYAGAGGAGGGAIKISASGAARVDGSILAGGIMATNERAGGGAGGSIWLTCETLTGSGSIIADGAAGEPSFGGGGGGGRIALYCETNSFAGTVHAHGGSGAVYGGAGTIFASSAVDPSGTVLLENEGHVGTNTLVSDVGALIISVQNGAVLRLPSPATLGALSVGSNGWVAAPFSSEITVLTDVRINAGGGLVADGTGHPGGQGIGAGRSGSDPYRFGGGAGHGGFGASSALGAVAGGAAYGGFENPDSPGSGGGNSLGLAVGSGGAGGGALRLNVGGALVVDGRISADGGSGIGAGSGGGSGGSLWLNAGRLSGAGLISACGGMGNGYGGGGAGGRIAFYLGTNPFGGAINAWGAGAGPKYGGPGTIYQKIGTGGLGQLVYDNGGRAGASSLGYHAQPVGVTLRGGSIVSPPLSATISSLAIGSNAWIVLTNYPLIVTDSAFIGEGGGIWADGTGFGPGQGTGAGRSLSAPPPGGGITVTSGGGAGHGGYGAASTLGAAAGYTYSIANAPTSPGSGGGIGSDSPTNWGGAGGGMIHLIVSNTLTHNGRITANGLTATNRNSGGGSGGSIWITAGAFEGTGAVSADGGGGNGYGGGGGGGRIAIYSPTNLFRGLLSAYGGAANANIGGAGTIYIKADISTSSSTWPQLVIDNGGRAGASSESLGQGYTSLLDLTVRGGAVTPVGYPLTVGNLNIASNSWIWLSNRFSGFLTVMTNALINAGAGIRADGCGYPGGQGPGPGRTFVSGSLAAGGGGGFGGFGGQGGFANAFGGSAYGSAVQWSEVGSGGGMASGTNSGGAGGGMIRLDVKGRLLLDGTLSANGLPGFGQNSGGGSGGSVQVTAVTFDGKGAIYANGGFGPGLGGGGGGGRISIMVDPRGGSNTFAGGITAYGGSGFNRGGAGTIYLSSLTRSVLIDNGGVRGTNTLMSDSGPFDVTVRNGGVLSGTRETRLPGIRNLTLDPNGWVWISDQVLSLAGNLTIRAGAGIVADGTGSPPEQGMGAGRGIYNGPRGGGGYGGFGAGNPPGSAGGRPYGSFLQPLNPGSGGASGSGSSFAPLGGRGGGAIRVTMSPISTLTLHGRISANGGAGDQNSGGGSGGSVWISTGTIVGSGSISADGGAGKDLGGGGGGGRVMVEFRTNLLSGPITAFGGDGYARGGAGTVYLRSLVSQNSGQVVLDNGGSPGLSSSLGQTSFVPGELTVRNGASGIVAGAITTQNLSLLSGGWLWFSNRLADSLTVNQNLVIDPASGITADGGGFPAAQGPGAGGSLYSPFGYSGGGGGHGGFGGMSFTGVAGGAAYDSVTAPELAGSGGGNGQGPAPFNLGGAGGGIVNLRVLGNLENNGRISANGMSGVTQSSGGGSGGTLLLSAGTLTGLGFISADGGDGNGLASGGGGGGGRIKLACSTNLFSGPVTALGGSGFLAGGAGTIYSVENNPSGGGQVIVDNAGQIGTNTAVALSAPVDLQIRNGGIVNPSSDYLVLSNLVIADNAFLTSLGTQSNLDVFVLGNASVASNGLITVDGKGFVQGTGPGAGLTTNNIGSGAGYGSQGGASSVLPGGPSYGSAQSPIDRGSGGGAGFGAMGGGSEGGGAIRLTIAGTLRLDGGISADGHPGLQDNAGGGSGGSILVTAGALEGEGLIRANGGAGEVFEGGGGAGGRIALYTRTNNFTGQLLALGADGWTRGEDGTVFTSAIFDAPVVVRHFPTGTLSNAIGSVDLEFNTPVLLDSVDTAALILLTPLGTLDPTNFGVAFSGSSTLHFSFPLLSAVGDYTLIASPGLVSDIFGQPLSQSYTGAFTVALPLIQGVVTDRNGQPVPGVLMQPSIGSAAVTDANGSYAIGAPPGIQFTVTPYHERLVIVPGSRTYSEITNSVADQDYVAFDSIAPRLVLEPQGTNIRMSWNSIAGVTYQVFYSTNLIDWMPFIVPVQGSGALMEYTLPIESDPARFYRLHVSN